MTVIRTPSSIKITDSGHDPLFADLQPESGDSASDPNVEEAKATAKHKLDHLGYPIKPGKNPQRYKYSRTFTIMYDSQKEKDIAAFKQHQVLRDSRRVINCRSASLRRLYEIFNESIGANSDQSLVGPRTFRLALARHGVKDVILMQRLYNEFRSPLGGSKIDFRAFIGVLCSMNDEPVEQKLDLLFDVWDVDEGGTLTHGELAPIIQGMVPEAQLEMMTDLFNKAWTEIRQICYGKSNSEGNKEDNWIGRSAASGVSKDDLVNAVLKSPSVRDFFDRILNRPPPKARDDVISFTDRMRELHMFMHRERKEFEKLEQLRLNAEAEEKKRNADVEGSGPNAFKTGSMKRSSSDSIVLRRQGSVADGKPALTRRTTSKHLGMSSKDLIKGYKTKYESSMRIPVVKTPTKLPPIGRPQRL